MTARVLVTMSGGVPTCYEEDEVETYVFDWGDYHASSDADRLSMRVPNSFRHLAEQAGAPFEPGDEDLTAAELETKYGGQHPEHQLLHWLNDAHMYNTRLGYWDWVAQQLKEAA